MSNALLSFLAEWAAQPVVLLLLKSTIIMTVGLLAWRLLSNGSASLRHTILKITMAALLVVPVLSAFGPSLLIQVPALDSAPVAVSDASTVTKSSAAIDSTTAPKKVAVNHRSDRDSQWPSANAIYVSGVSLVIAYLLLGLARVFWLTRRARALPANSECYAALANEERQGIRLVVSEKSAIPLTWGVISPVIVLPRQSEQWTKENRINALRHEIAHVARHDWSAQIFARVVCALYWFNPLVWIVYRQLLLEAERAADDSVLAKGANPGGYAEQLVNLARAAKNHRVLPIAATTMAEKAQLAIRVRSILRFNEMNNSLSRFRQCVSMLLVCAVILLVSTLQLVVRADSPERESYSGGDTVDTTPLIHAASQGAVDEVRRLLQSGADVNEVRTAKPRDARYQRTALNTAIATGHLDVTEVLLNAGADINRAVRGDATPLIEAIRHGHSDVAELLLDRGADAMQTVRGDGSPLIAAARTGNTAMASKLIALGANPEQEVSGDETPLFHASTIGNVKLLRLLIDNGVDVNQTFDGDGTALIIAVRNGHQAAAEVLLAAGARADKSVGGDGNAMIVAASRGDVESLQKMIGAGADVNASVRGDGNPLIAAARNGKLNAVELLIQNGANVDQVVPGDENALIGAAWNGKIDVVTYLLDVGADPNIQVKVGWGKTRTALKQATLGGHDEVVRVLVAAGASE